MCVTLSDSNCFRNFVYRLHADVVQFLVSLRVKCTGCDLRGSCCLFLAAEGSGGSYFQSASVTSFFFVAIVVLFGFVV